ncbi:hypothetical protein L596_001218 [Steinernema carpocapsae]|uniref:Uncharacterized protein n=1 Tax=Steinernema carpocapsae TaxID=34508 RepID=A0A4U8UKM3_STECR|nr:hypothetical protein L596_001218 [Steinernema carpocapsae]
MIDIVVYLLLLEGNSKLFSLKPIDFHSVQGNCPFRCTNRQTEERLIETEKNFKERTLNKLKTLPFFESKISMNLTEFNCSSTTDLETTVTYEFLLMMIRLVR